MLLVVLMLSTSAMGQVVIEHTIPQGKSYWKYDRSGQRITASRVPVIGGPIIPEDPGGGGPTDPPDPPNGLSGIAKVAYDAGVRTGRRDEAAVVAATLKALGEAISTGGIPYTDASDATNTAFNAIYLGLGAGSRQRWVGWRADLKVEVDKLIAAGRLRTAGDLATVYANMAHGLEVYAGQAGMDAAQELNLSRILRLVTAIIAKDIPAIIAIIQEIVAERRGGR
jgi:hypothetical protein